MAFPFSIGSREFPGVFLQVSEPDKGGKPSSVSLVNPVTEAGRFVLVAKGDDIWGIQSVKYPGYFLFLDGTVLADVPKGTFPTGAGKVWVSNELNDFAHFKLVQNPSHGGYNIQSTTTAQSFLRLDGKTIQQNGLPGGIVNVQNYASRYEAFNITYFPVGDYDITTLPAAPAPEPGTSEKS